MLLRNYQNFKTQAWPVFVCYTNPTGSKVRAFEQEEKKKEVKLIFS